MKRVILLSTLALVGCASHDAQQAARVATQAKNESARSQVTATAQAHALDQYFYGEHTLRNACVVGFRNRTTLQGADSRAFKASSAQAQTLTDYAYERFTGELKRYGYNVVERQTLAESKAYRSFGDRGMHAGRKNRSSHGFQHDARGLRHYGLSAEGSTALFQGDQSWGKDLYAQTGCEVVFNVEMLNQMSTQGASKGAVAGMYVDSKIDFTFTANVLWPVWQKAMANGQPIQTAAHYGGRASLTAPVEARLAFPMVHPKDRVPASTEADRLQSLSEASLRKSVDRAVDYTLRAFHMNVYTKMTPAAE